MTPVCGTRSTIQHMMKNAGDRGARPRSCSAVASRRCDGLELLDGTRPGDRAARALGLRQVHADARGRRACRSVTSGTVEVLGLPAGDRAAARPGRLRHPGAQRVRRPDRRREPPLLRPRARRRRAPRSTACIEAVDLGRRPRPGGRPALRRPALPGLAGGRAARQPRAAGPRRADGRPRPGAAPRPVGDVPRLADAGTAVLVSSHVMDEAERCDRLLLMRDGRLIADDTPAGCSPRTGTDGHRGGVPRPRGAGGGGMSPRITARRRRPGADPAAPRPPHAGDAAGAALPGADAAVVDVPATARHGFDALGPPLLALIPFIVMFLVTSVTTLRERSSGTLERLLAMPTGKGDFLGRLRARVRAGRRRAVGAGGAAVSVPCSASTSPGRSGCWSWSRSPTPCSARALGLFVSAFARTEFQAVQFMPVAGDPADPAVRAVRAARRRCRRCSRRSRTCCRCPTPSTR